MSIVNSTHVKKKVQMLATKCNVEIKIKKDMLQQNGKGKTNEAVRGRITWCAKTERMKKSNRETTAAQLEL